jgi:hypothetical protein
MARYVIPFVEIDDKNEASIARDMLTRFMGLPNNPITEFGPDSIIAQLFAAFSLLASAEQYLANKSVRSLKQSYYALHGFQKKDATYPWVTVTFTLHEPLSIDYSIKSGVIIQTSTLPTIRYKTLYDIDFAPGETSKETVAVSEYPGSDYKVNAEQLNQLLTPLPYVASINATGSAGGEDPESDEDALIRMQQEAFSHGTATTPESYENLAVQVPGVYRAKCWPLTDYYSPVENTPSYSTLVIQQSVGFEPGNLVSDVNEYLEPRKAVGWPIITITPNYHDIDVTAKIRLNGSTLESAIMQITSLLEYEFKNWEWGKSITPTEIKEKILSLACVSSCSMTSPSEPIEIGKFGLPKLGEVSITLWQ